MADVDFRIVNIGALSMNRFWGEAERLHTTSATCTLLTVGDTRVLVDPSPQADQLAEKLFDRTGLRPNAVDMVYLTHYHGDHRFGLDLFDGKPWCMAADEIEEWRQHAPDEADVFGRFVPAEDVLPESLNLLPTPGHTLAQHSIRCETEWGVLVVAGDACMTREFFAAEEGFHNSLDFDRAAESIRLIKHTADLVIPGHDNLILNCRT